MPLWVDVRVESEFRGREQAPSSSMQEVRDRLRAIASSLDRTQMREVLNEVGEIYRQNILTRFASHTNPQGQSWRWLAPATIRKKQRGMGNRPPSIPSVQPRNHANIPVTPYSQLIWTGKLIKAIRTVVDSRRAMVTVGVSSHQVPYAWVHQMGGGNGIPMRKYLGYNQRTNAAAMRAIRDYLQRAASG